VSTTPAATASSQGRRLFDNQVRCLLAGDPDRLVTENYQPDATVQSFQATVTGADALKVHFGQYLATVRILEVVSVDAFAETAESVAFEATIRTDKGIVHVYDVMMLRDGRIAFHFTGIR
jgi:SnoaL-like domain